MTPAIPSPSPAPPGTAPAADAAPVIRINGLHKAYGALEVLKGVDLTAPRGHVEFFVERMFRQGAAA